MTDVLDSFDRIERVTLGERVYQEMRERLVAGEMAPGDRMSLRRLADAIGVSVMPVREAVTRLVADGALEVLPNRSISVPVMTREKFRELTAIRITIEGFAAAQAASSRGEADLDLMRRFEGAFRAEAHQPLPDARAAIRANKELHFAVYRAAGLPTLVSIIQGLWLKIGPVLNLDMRDSPERLATGVAGGAHARLVAAIESRDAEGARAALVEDIENTAAFIQQSGRLPG